MGIWDFMGLTKNSHLPCNRYQGDEVHSMLYYTSYFLLYIGTKCYIYFRWSITQYYLRRNNSFEAVISNTVYIYIFFSTTLLSLVTYVFKTKPRVLSNSTSTFYE